MSYVFPVIVVNNLEIVVLIFLLEAVFRVVVRPVVGDYFLARGA